MEFTAIGLPKFKRKYMAYCSGCHIAEKRTDNNISRIISYIYICIRDPLSFSQFDIRLFKHTLQRLFFETEQIQLIKYMKLYLNNNQAPVATHGETDDWCELRRNSFIQNSIGFHSLELYCLNSV